MPEHKPRLPLAGRTSIQGRALFLGERLDLRPLQNVGPLAAAPLTLAVREQGCAVLFRYGVAVLFDVPPIEEVAFLASLRPLLTQPFEQPDIEEVEIHVRAEERDKIQGGTIFLQTPSVERLQLVAEALARSVVLERYERNVDREFDRIEPLAVGLRGRRFAHALARDLLQHIGSALLSQQRMVGKVALSEKPELLWDHPGLERFYARLEDEYEIRERHLVLEQKMEVIARTAQTVLGLLHARRSLRVEWYIVILIVVEILLTLYELFFHS
jgi:uncharacterized Rmd1/YagE family protein